MHQTYHNYILSASRMCAGERTPAAYQNERAKEISFIFSSNHFGCTFSPRSKPTAKVACFLYCIPHQLTIWIGNITNQNSQSIFAERSSVRHGRRYWARYGLRPAYGPSAKQETNPFCWCCCCWPTLPGLYSYRRGGLGLKYKLAGSSGRFSNGSARARGLDVKSPCRYRLHTIQHKLKSNATKLAVLRRAGGFYFIKSISKRAFNHPNTGGAVRDAGRATFLCSRQAASLLPPTAAWALSEGFEVGRPGTISQLWRRLWMHWQ